MNVRSACRSFRMGVFFKLIIHHEVQGVNRMDLAPKGKNIDAVALIEEVDVSTVARLRF